jgi:hypothetical protein
MNSIASSVHFKIINIWLGFVVLVMIASNFPHQSLDFWSWLNIALYFGIALQCVFIFIKVPHNRMIFFNIALYCGAFSVWSLLQIFSGSDYLLGDDYFRFYVFQYRKIFLSALLGLAVVYVCVKYVFKNLKPLPTLGVSLLVMLPFFLWHFYPFLADVDYLRVNFKDDIVLYKSMLYFSLFSFSMVCLYGLLLYLNEKSLGEHINTLMACFFILTAVDSVDNLSRIYDIKIFSISQYVLLVIHFVFIITFFKKLDFVYSDFGQFYENMMVAGNGTGVPIKRKKSRVVLALFEFTRLYFHQRKHVFGILILLSVIGINYFNVSPYIKLCLIAFFAGTLVLILYLSALHQKRLAANDLLFSESATEVTDR